MIPVTSIEYTPNVDQLFLEIDFFKDQFVPYEDEKHGSVEGWLILRENADTIVLKSEREKFNEQYNLVGRSRARYYIQDSGVKIPAHIDYNTKCSANFILSGGSDPVSFDAGEFIYTSAILDTTQKHWVNSTSKRVLFKISYFDLSYEEILGKINEPI